jgi:hypothetical protein
MTDANDYRNVAQDPEFKQRMAQDAQQASPETLARYYASLGSQLNQTHNAHNARAIAAYEEARMGARPKPKFELHLINHDHFYANRRRLPAGLLDMVMVAIGGAMWFAILFGLWLVFG